MTACYCDDGEPVDVYAVTQQKARKEYRCYECQKPIAPGEKYERLATLYEGHWETTRTCCRCLDLRQYVEAHAPCFCWAHGTMLDDAIDVIRDHGHVSAGFFIGATKRLIRASRELPWATERHKMRTPTRPIAAARGIDRPKA